MSYIGASPAQRGGFGRKGGFGTAPQPQPDHTLSAAAQAFIAEERARAAAQLAGAAEQLAAVETAALVNDIDFAIGGGGDSQYVEIELDPGEAVIAQIDTLIWKDRAVGFEAILGDGHKAGVLNKITSAGTNALGGEGLFMAEYRHCGSGKARVALGGRSAGHILPVRLEAMGGMLVCQQGAFLAAAKGISVSIKMVSSFWAGVNGGTGFVLQTLSGTGWAFLHVSGALIERELTSGETIHVEPGCIAAMEPGVQYDTDELIMPGGGFGSGVGQMMKADMAGVRNMECARLTGPGKVWLQSLPTRTRNSAAPGDPSAVRAFLAGGAATAGHAVAKAALDQASSADVLNSIGKLWER